MGQDDIEGGGKDRKVSAQVGKAPTHLPIGGKTEAAATTRDGRPGPPAGEPAARARAEASLWGSCSRQLTSACEAVAPVPGTPSNECGGAGPHTHRGVLGPSLLCGRREADLDLTAGVGCTPGGSRRGLRAPVRSLVQRGPLPPRG